MAKPKKATPSQRLAAQKPRARAKAPRAEEMSALADGLANEQDKLFAALDETPELSMSMLAAKPASMRLRSKWLVVDKREVVDIVDGAPRPRWIVHMKAIYEPLSILHGQATVQGCADNRMFGTGVPEAEQILKIDSKAIADAYQVGRAYLQDHLEVQPELRPLW